MINAYREGKDLYATIACKVYNNTYWENMEHWEDGSPNDAGATRRKRVKSLLLGIMYCMGASALAESIKSTKDEAQKIIDDFYNGFPDVAKWIEKTKIDARKNAYVEDFWGRRRRLPDLHLPEYEIFITGNTPTTFNPLLNCKGIITKEEPKEIKEFKHKLAKCKYKSETDKIIAEAQKKNVIIKSNSGYIAQAERQCVNARIQGSASTMTKKAMIKVYNDKILNNLGFKMLITVHDELIGECPEENAQAVADRLCEVMKTCVQDDIVTPFKCDPTIEKLWAETAIKNRIKEEYVEYINNKNVSESKAIDYIVTNHCELVREDLIELIKNS